MIFILEPWMNELTSRINPGTDYTWFYPKSLLKKDETISF